MFFPKRCQVDSLARAPEKIQRIAICLMVELFYGIFFLATVFPVQNAQAEKLDLSQVPASVANPVAPNIAFTFDDSGSMGKAFLPDDIESLSNLKAVKSVHFNKQTYNPELVYQPGEDASGTSLPQADFNNAILASRTEAGGQKIYDIYRVVANNLKASDYAVDLSQHYRHPWNFLSGDAAIQYAQESGDGPNGQPAYYYTWNESLSGCDQNISNDACYEKTIVQENEKQNFANWYQYHSLRLSVGKTAVTTAFNNLPSSVRLARQAINRQGLKSGNDNNYIAAFGPENKSAFYQWLFSITPGGSTPLRSAMITAGEFFANSENNNAYENIPGSNVDGAEEITSCRRNFHVMFTDGYYSEESSEKLSAIGDFDQRALSGKNWPGPAAFSYDPQDFAMAIFGGPGASTLADIAFYYWANDLQTGQDFENNVRPVIRSSVSAVEDLSKQEYWDPANDPSTWQNMNNFIIAFGVNGKFDVNSEQDYQALLAGTQDWLSPVPIDSNDVDKMNAIVDDLWHAAIASRGQYYSTTKTAGFEQALNDIINQFRRTESSVAAVTVNSASLGNGSAFYQAGFESSTWTGFLKKFLLSDGSENDAGSDAENTASCNTRPAGTPCETSIEVNHASVPDWAEKKVFSYNPVLELTNKGINLSGGSSLRWSQLSDQQKQDLRIAEGVTAAKRRLDYVLGDKQFEVAENNGGNFRTRNDEQRTLGAIVNGGPLLVGNGINADGSFTRFYPDFISPAGRSYAEFLTTIQSRPEMIYAGAADGQLHAYLAEDLRQVFSFIPDAVFPYLDDYSDQDFSFWPFVDGPQKAGDVFINNSWATILVGSFRSSAKGLYGLNITEPNHFGANEVLWEYSERRFPNDRNLGHVYGAASIVRTAQNSLENNLATGDWLVAFSNGYNSVNGRAVLYFLNPETGEVVRQIDTGVGPDSGVDQAGDAMETDFNVVADIPNGLGPATVIDLEGDYKADLAYAGDLYGNLWRFDLRDSNADNWFVELVYAANDQASVAQPITGAPVVGRHLDGKPGLMVYFGTGKYLELSDADVANAGVQTLYGIWDRVDLNLLIDADGDDKPANDDNQIVGGFTRKHLLQQKILQQDVFAGKQNVEIRTLSAKALKFFPGTGLPGDDEGYLGWYLDFDTEEGERITTQPILRGTNIIVVTQTPFIDVCESGGSSWLLEINARTGGTPAAQALDNNGDGLINTADYYNGAYTAGWKRLGLGSYSIPAIVYDRASGVEHKIISTGSGSVSSLAEQPPPGDTGRQAWRQLR